MAVTSYPRQLLRIPHTFSVPGDLLVPSGSDNVIPGFYVPVLSGQSVSLSTVRHSIGAGTSAVITLSRNGTAVPGASVTSTPTPGTLTFAAITLNNDDFLSIAVSSPTGVPKNLSFTLYFDHYGA